MKLLENKLNSLTNKINFKNGEEIKTDYYKNTYTNQEKIDSKELAQELNKLSEKEKEKIFYMIKGAALVTETETEKHEKNSI